MQRFAPCGVPVGAGNPSCWHVRTHLHLHRPTAWSGLGRGSGPQRHKAPKVARHDARNIARIDKPQPVHAPHDQIGRSRVLDLSSFRSGLLRAIRQKKNGTDFCCDRFLQLRLAAAQSA